MGWLQKKPVQPIFNISARNMKTRLRRDNARKNRGALGCSRISALIPARGANKELEGTARARRRHGGGGEEELEREAGEEKKNTHKGGGVNAG